jgi:hypothetical protein
MNQLELKMVDHLKYLKSDFGVVEVKAEFEAEGSRLYELMRLKEIATVAGLGLVLKIGGAEAVTDMFYAKSLGASVIVAPMVESGYAMRKYLEAIDKHFSDDEKKSIEFCAMIETNQAYINMASILDQKLGKLVTMIAVGRVDLSGSLDIARIDINCSQILKIVTDVFTKVKNKGLRTTMGGGIAKEAIPFISQLISKKLLDRYETRKIVFDGSKKNKNIEQGIVEANRFEMMWLENKKNYYDSIATEDDLRLVMLKSRIPPKNG